MCRELWVKNMRLLWKRGFHRLYLALAVVWIIGGGLYSYEKEKGEGALACGQLAVAQAIESSVDSQMAAEKIEGLPPGAIVVPIQPQSGGSMRTIQEVAEAERRGVDVQVLTCAGL